ncbi:molybdate transport system permease protein [Desulfoscipio geothermicus DSM 3669]|uniref:Molybdate transport system permease protein n=1 Tax=Desulfoscipio geothermicus DSM 3669 TaxID=1121426 RepID=A0A1I6ECT4_9FIRM|nr:molybdate transport system permease protein [Desulfoscipio geothermicus DSM 3669]
MALVSWKLSSQKAAAKVGKNGLLGHILANMGISLIFTWWAAVLAAAVVAFPLMYQSARAAFKSVDINYEKAARPWERVSSGYSSSLPFPWPGRA